jgi:glycerol-3-phosphate cytidylyltransferase
MEGRMRILTLGTFDIPHWGHLTFLNKCRLYGEVYIGLNTDEFIEKYKGKRPIFSYAERVQTLSLWGFENILPNNQPDGTIKDVVQEVKPEIIIIGSDWLRKEYLTQIGLTPDYMDEKDITLIYVPYTREISTTEIKKRCQSR